MSNELVERCSDHIAVISILKNLDVLFGGEDGEEAGDDRSGVELGEADRVETERSDGVRNRLNNLLRRVSTTRERRARGRTSMEDGMDSSIASYSASGTLAS